MRGKRHSDHTAILANEWTATSADIRSSPDPQNTNDLFSTGTKSIFDALPKDTPAIHFGTGNPELYPAMKEAGGDVIGIDWRTSIDDAWSALGDDVGIQGNMDPAALLASSDVMKARASEVLDSAAGRPGHIFNLGHGIMPEASPAQARALVDHVHEASAR